MKKVLRPVCRVLAFVLAAGIFLIALPFILAGLVLVAAGLFTLVLGIFPLALSFLWLLTSMGRKNWTKALKDYRKSTKKKDWEDVIH